MRKKWTSGAEKSKSVKTKRNQRVKISKPNNATRREDYRTRMGKEKEETLVGGRPDISQEKNHKRDKEKPLMWGNDKISVGGRSREKGGRRVIN